MENLDIYIPAHAPDKTRIAKCLADAKGPDRTMAEFAIECGVSPSTFSRILNLKMSRPLSDELVLAIVAHKRAGSFLELEDLMRANGKITLEEKEKEDKRKEESAPFLSGPEYKDKKIKVRNILITELVSRGVMLQVLPRIIPISSRVEKPQDPLDTMVRGEFSFSYHQQGEDPRTWMFVNVGSLFDESERPHRMQVRRFLRDFAVLFLMDDWHPEGMKDKKFSFLFWNAEYYEQILSILDQRIFNNEISAILVDVEKECVVKETIFPMKGKKEPASIFDLEPTIPFTEDEEEWDQER